MSFKVIDVSKQKQDKYGLLEKQIQSLIEQKSISPLLDKLVDFRDALALELYDQEFFNEHGIKLFDRLQKCFENNKFDRIFGCVEQELNDLEGIINFVNLVSDEVIRKIIKEIK